MKHSISIRIAFLSIICSTLACANGLPSRGQLEDGVATVQAVGEQASELATRTAPTIQAAAEQAADLATRSAPTLQAAAEQAREFALNAGPTVNAARTRASVYATEAAPTVIALRTQASTFATESAPTIEAGLETLATAVVESGERAAQARATLNAAGIDAGYLLRKVASLRPDETGRIFVTFTEDEVNLALNARMLLMKEQGNEPPVRETEVRFSNGAISFRGRISNPVEGQIELILIPFADSGQLRYELASATLNGNQMPQFVLVRLESLINSTLTTAVSGFPDAFELQSVFVEQGTLTFVAERAER